MFVSTCVVQDIMCLQLENTVGVMKCNSHLKTIWFETINQHNIYQIFSCHYQKQRQKPKKSYNNNPYANTKAAAALVVKDARTHTGFLYSGAPVFILCHYKRLPQTGNVLPWATP